MGFVLLLVAFLASVLGAVCGIGGGVMIKPVLDFLSVASVSAISFLSSCTVLAMSVYSVGHSLVARENTLDIRRGTPLALGGAVGGVAGSLLFEWVKTATGEQNRVGAVQAVCLALVTLGALVYTLCKNRIKTHNTTALPACLAIGAVLGLISSFLGVGGGPINLVVLYFFFSMDTKTAAQNSLYIILFGQAANILSTIFVGAVPAFAPSQLVLMVLGGVAGGIAGRAAHKHMPEKALNVLFALLMSLIILLSCVNVVRFTA